MRRLRHIIVRSHLHDVPDVCAGSLPQKFLNLILKWCQKYLMLLMNWRFSSVKKFICIIGRLFAHIGFSKAAGFVWVLIKTKPFNWDWFYFLAAINVEVAIGENRALVLTYFKSSLWLFYLFLRLLVESCCDESGFGQDLQGTEKGNETQAKLRTNSEEISSLVLKCVETAQTIWEILNSSYKSATLVDCYSRA